MCSTTYNKYDHLQCDIMAIKYTNRKFNSFKLDLY